jgi:hypothetical protein
MGKGRTRRPISFSSLLIRPFANSRLTKLINMRHQGKVCPEKNQKFLFLRNEAQMPIAVIIR